MKKIVRVVLVILIFVLSFQIIDTSVQASELKVIQDEYQNEKEQWRNKLLSGNISQDEFLAADMMAMYQRQYRVLSSPTAAQEYLEQEAIPKTESNKKQMLEYIYKEDVMGYYWESCGRTDSSKLGLPQLSFSEPIPMIYKEMLLAVGEGYLTEENLKQYVSAWVFVGYADGDPFGVFQVSRLEGNLLVSGIVPDIQTAVAYDSLLEIEGCYTTSAMIAPEISYLVVKDGVVQSVHQRDVKTLETEDITTNAKDTEFYHYARNIASIRSLEVSIKNEEAVLLGGKAAEAVYTFEDAKRQAYFDLYIRPYLIPAVAVLVLGAAVIIVLRKRKQKKA